MLCIHPRNYERAVRRINALHTKRGTFPSLDRFSTEKEDLYVCSPFAHIFDNLRTDRIASYRIPVHQKVLHQKLWLCCIYGALSASTPEIREKEVAEDLFDILLNWIRGMKNDWAGFCYVFARSLECVGYRISV